MPPKLSKWLILIGLLTYAVCMSAWAVSSLRTRKCTGIDIEVKPGTDGKSSFLKPEAVKMELGQLASQYGNMSLYEIDTDSLEKHLNAVNNFEHVEVVRTSSGKLLISVVPIIPELRVFTPTNTYYINKDGKCMDAHAEYFADLPIVRGNFTTRMPASGVLPVSRYIQKDSLLRDLITMIEYRSPSNIILIPRIRGHVINIGDTTNLADKFNRLLLMYRKVMPHKGWLTYDTISLKFRGQIVATRADKTLQKHNNVDETLIEDFEEASLDMQTMKVTGTETSDPEQKETQSTHPETTEE